MWDSAWLASAPPPPPAAARRHPWPVLSAALPCYSEIGLAGRPSSGLNLHNGCHSLAGITRFHCPICRGCRSPPLPVALCLFRRSLAGSDIKAGGTTEREPGNSGATQWVKNAVSSEGVGPQPASGRPGASRLVAGYSGGGAAAGEHWHGCRCARQPLAPSGRIRMRSGQARRWRGQAQGREGPQACHTLL